MKAKFFVIYISFVTIFLTMTGFGQENSYMQERFEMVEMQIQSRGITDTDVPEALKNQLAEGGKMIIPVGENQVQQLVLLQKRNGKIRQKEMLPVRFVPMIDKNN